MGKAMRKLLSRIKFVLAERLVNLPYDLAQMFQRITLAAISSNHRCTFGNLIRFVQCPNNSFFFLVALNIVMCFSFG